MPQRKKPERNKDHLEFIRQLPCLVCGDNTSTEAAHIRSGTDGGMGMKPSDKFVIPMCHTCHAMQHNYGERVYWGQFHISPLEVAAELWQASGDYDEGLRIVERANG